MSRTKILRSGVIAGGLACLFLFIATKNEDFMSAYTEKIEGYGELYDMARVTKFKIPLPPSKKYPNEKKLITDNINEAEIIVFGDSFMDANYGHYSFPAMIADQLSKKVFISGYDWDSPLQLLKNLNYTKEEKKYLIMESCERYLLYRFGKNISFRQMISVSQDSKNILSSLSEIRSKWFVNADRQYDYFFQNYFFFNNTGWTEWLADIRFEYAGHINSLTPEYSLTPPMLFYHEGVESFEYHHSENEIEKIAVNILTIKKELEEQYNIELIFLPVSDKYTIYHTLINNKDYDNFIPRICERLKEMKSINLTEDYKNSKELVYHSTDNHWNAYGAEIALRKTIEELK